MLSTIFIALFFLLHPQIKQFVHWNYELIKWLNLELECYSYNVHLLAVDAYLLLDVNPGE